ncbi:MAG: HAD family phosphatase [Elusimicrobiota bacterium]
MSKRERASSPNAVRVVFFDIGNVLLKFDVTHVISRIAVAVSRHPLRVGRLLWNRELVDGIERGEITTSELYAIFQDELAYEGDFPSFVKLWCDYFTLDTRADRILNRLVRRLPVYLLSNTNRLHYEFIRANYSFARRVKGAVLSYRLGARKPEPAIYRAALKRARVRAGSALFIDDRAENIEGAKREGLHAILYTGAEALERSLVEMNLLRGGPKKRPSARTAGDVRRPLRGRTRSRTRASRNENPARK